MNWHALVFGSAVGLVVGLAVIMIVRDLFRSP